MQFKKLRMIINILRGRGVMYKMDLEIKNPIKVLNENAIIISNKLIHI